MWGNLTRSVSKVQDRAKSLLSDKTSNLARLAFVTAHNHMVSRHLYGFFFSFFFFSFYLLLFREGSVEVEVTLGYFIVSLAAEIEEAETEEKGAVELVEDSSVNLGPTQISIYHNHCDFFFCFLFFSFFFDCRYSKPTKNMHKTLDKRILDLLDTLETTTVKMVPNYVLFCLFYPNLPVDEGSRNNCKIWYYNWYPKF
jgi:hypothetical protein